MPFSPVGNCIPILIMLAPHNTAAGIRAHSFSSAVSRPGRPGVLGVRREDKNKWERRVPITPDNVRELVKKGITVIVQPSNRRCFTDQEFKDAGALISEDLSEAGTILAVKEVEHKILRT
jgi:alpha-aminoadipic semialdehyde synthase